MSKEKQIEEMAKIACNACEFGGGFDGGCSGDYDYRKCNNARETALALFNAGYRKQSEGKWKIKTDDFDCEYVMCSVCKEEFYPADDDTVDATPNFCPNCGARMKGGEE